jgi:hypothetical protein
MDLDYSDFCERHFGFFLHHVPAEAEEEAPADEGAVRAAVQRQFERSTTCSARRR